MTEELKGSRKGKGFGAAEEQRRLLIEGMSRTRAELNQAYAQFNLHSDPDLVESCVFTIKALRSRYSYLIRQLKLLEEGKAEAV